MIRRRPFKYQHAFEVIILSTSDTQEFVTKDLDPIYTGKVPTPGDIEGFPGFGHIPMKGAPNTRDLGGMPTKDGRRVRANRLIRSGDLHHLTKEDAEKLLVSEGLQRVVDFRTPREREKSPDKEELLPHVRFYDLPVFEESAVGISHDFDLSGDIAFAEEATKSPDKTMESMYVKALESDEGKRAYGDFLQILLESDNGATLWHCTLGKDRCGLGSFLVEYALGVSEDFIMDDYLATNLFVETYRKRILDMLGRHGVMKFADKNVDAFMFAQRAFLENAIAYLKSTYGSVDEYLSQALHFGKGKQLELQEKYLV